MTAVGEAAMSWTMKDIRDAAGVACSRIRVAPGKAREADMRDVAQSAVGLAIAENPAIDWPDAVAAAARAVWDAVGAGLNQHGFTNAGEERPRFAAYWLDWARPHSTVGYGTVEERLLMRSLLDQLPERHAATLLALGCSDTMADAADAVGVPYMRFRQRVETARTVALALIFDWETPPALQRLPINQRQRERLCRAGHLIAGDNVERNFCNGRVVERCRTCRREQNRARKARRSA